MAALYRGHREIVDALVESTAAVDIFAAAALGRLDDLRAALARPGAVNDVAYDGWTPLHLAAFFGETESGRLLLDAGANVQAISANSLRNTPLHAATAGGHAESALLLIERGADVKVPDAGKHTPLHIAAESGLTDVVQSPSRARRGSAGGGRRRSDAAVACRREEPSRDRRLAERQAS